VYSKYIAQRKGSKDYWIQLSIDFKRLKPGLQLEKLISWHNLYLLSELCYNLSLLRDVKHKTLSKPIKMNAQSSKVERKHMPQKRILNRSKK
jgi:hypothetical protein